MGTAPTSSGLLLVAEGFPVALPAGATMLASILYSSALVHGQFFSFGCGAGSGDLIGN
jgi:hypothetical protein